MRNERIFETWLACYTHDEIATTLEIKSKSGVNDRITALCSESFHGKIPNKLSKFVDDDWKHLLYSANITYGSPSPWPA